MINFIKEVLFIFIASGGCGCLNHYILTNTNVIEEHTDLYKERITLGSLISINLLMCFGFIEFGHLSLYKSVLITFLLTLISSFTVHAYVIKLFRTLVNLIRKGKGVKKMKHKLPKFLTEKHINIGDELNKLFMINNTQSLFVQYGDRVVCVYMADEKFYRCNYDKNGILVIKHYICEPQFKSLYRKFLDNEIDCLNYEDVMNGCNKFYLNSDEDYKKFLRALIDM